MKKTVFGVVTAVAWVIVFIWIGCRWDMVAALTAWLASMLFGTLLLLEFGDDDAELILEPLSLEEARNCDVCWLETRVGYYVEPCAVGDVCERRPGKRPVYVIGQDVGSAPTFADAEYGHYWRCWAEKPTEEDCKAAPWNDMKQEDDTNGG